MRLPPSLVLAFLIAALASGLPGTRVDAQQAGDGMQLEDLAAFPKATLGIRGAAGLQSFDIWVADTPARQEQGLMFVRDLPANQGMLFVESEPRVSTMWMKNTYIELDMLFIRSDGRIAAIFNRTVPHSLETISAGEPVKAVLELRGGEALRRGIKVGDLVIHPAFGARARAPHHATAQPAAAAAPAH